MMNQPMITYVTQSPEETEQLGVRIGSLLHPGTVISLDGSLGLGKTVIVKGIVKGALDLDPNFLVTSPAFSLVNEYADEVHTFTVYHMDFYRLDNLTNEDFEMFSEYLDDENGVVLVEWGSRFLPKLCSEFLTIQLDFGEDKSQDLRMIQIGSYGTSELYSSLLEKIKIHVNNPS